MSFNKFISGFKVIEPLSNYQIIEKCEELNIKCFKGVFMSDELNKNRKASNHECLIINIDHNNDNKTGGTGTHWTSLFIKDKKSYYFDSYGFPPTQEVKEYCTGDREYNSFEIQKYNEVICGHYCIYVLLQLSSGYTFEDILDELMS